MKRTRTTRPRVQRFSNPVTQGTFRFHIQNERRSSNTRPHSSNPITNNLRSNNTAYVRPAGFRMNNNNNMPRFHHTNTNHYSDIRQPNGTLSRFTSHGLPPRSHVANMPRFHRNTYRFQEQHRRTFWRPKNNQWRGQRRRNNFLMNRRWIVVSDKNSSENRTSENFCFSIVSYNVLSDELLYGNRYLYEDCDSDTLHWSFRKGNLMREILGYNSDILCLQEIDEAHYENWFKPTLECSGYDSVYNKRTGDKPDGCAIFYRSWKFALVQKKLVKYCNMECPILNKDNVGIVILLKPLVEKDTSSNLCVANTHLLFNKKRGDIKLAQLAYLLAEIDGVARIEGNLHHPIILCGDLNSLPFSPLYDLLITKQLDYSVRSAATISGQSLPSQITSGPSSRLLRPPLLPWQLGITLNCQWRTSDGNISEEQHNETKVLTIPFGFQSVYKHIENGVPEVTTCHIRACCSVDYIFYTQRDDSSGSSGQPGGLTLVGKLQLPGEKDFITKLPNYDLSSDHIALKARFELSL